MRYYYSEPYLEKPPLTNDEAHRALELLEDYHSRLVRPEDRQLRNAIERVLTIFKSRLFQALLDIQEYYEVTLMDERKSLSQKTEETNDIVERWETYPPMVGSEKAAPISGQMTPSRDNGYPTYSANQSPYASRPGLTNDTHDRDYIPPVDRSYDSAANGHEPAPVSQPEDWDYEEINLEKGRTGLGFSIAGGNDNPHVGNDPSIYVTKIIDGGAAAIDGRLRPDDIIMSVNGTNTINVPHHVAVDALKTAGNNVRLYVKRLKAVAYIPETTLDGPPQPVRHASGGGSGVAMMGAGRPTTPSAGGGEPVEVFELHKGHKGLGFSIAGGVGNEHLPGDTGIYVTKIIEGGAAQQDGRLQVGDKLLAVNSVSLHGVTHDIAVNILKQTDNHVTVKVQKTSYSGNRFPDTSLQGTDYFSAGTLPTTSINQPAVYDHQRHPSGYGADSYQPATPSYGYGQEIGRGPRRVTLTKGTGGLGFNIVGGEDGEGIYISHVAPGGVADLSGQIHKGDQLLEVNGVDLRLATHESAATALKNSGRVVEILAQYKPDQYAAFEAKIEKIRNEMIHQQNSAPRVAPRKDLYVRARFDYDPSRDAGLPNRGLAFSYGDILHVTNSSDDEWWQARRVLTNLDEEGYGIIPSKKRVEKRERSRRKTVNFGAGRMGSISEKHKKNSLSFSKKFPFMKSKERLNDESDDRMEDSVLSYEPVERRELNYVRPVIVLGALKSRINDDLILQDPDRFGSCVPHTTRPRREHEVDGRDYHFVRSREQMEEDIRRNLFIEAGQFKENLYGTSVASVRQVADEGKHCVLDVSGNAVKRLQAAELHPIAVFIKPDSPEQLLEWNRRLTREEAEKEFSRAEMIEQEFAEYFTAIVRGHTPEEVYARVRQVIAEQSAPMVWMPTQERI